jgi:hypothetical protein
MEWKWDINMKLSKKYNYDSWLRKLT